MQIIFSERYRLKEGSEPAFGFDTYGRTNLVPLIVDTNDKTVMVQPSGYSDSTSFWAAIDDLELDE